jgi:hypothetical protein
MPCRFHSFEDSQRLPQTCSAVVRQRSSHCGSIWSLCCDVYYKGQFQTIAKALHQQTQELTPSRALAPFLALSNTRLKHQSEANSPNVFPPVPIGTVLRLFCDVCRPDPISLPTAREVEFATAEMRGLEQAYSPVFFSAKEDGTVEQGLHNLAVKPGEAVLLVGNHQTIPLDTGFHVAEVCGMRQIPRKPSRGPALWCWIVSVTNANVAAVLYASCRTHC